MRAASARNGSRRAALTNWRGAHEHDRAAGRREGERALAGARRLRGAVVEEEACQVLRPGPALARPAPREGTARASWNSAKRRWQAGRSSRRRAPVRARSTVPAA